MDSMVRRFNADALVLSNDKKKCFIDMRRQSEIGGVQERIRKHEKKLSTFMMYDKEVKKLHDQTRCPWSERKIIPETAIFVLFENVPAKQAKESRQGKPAKVQPVSAFLPISMKLTNCRPHNQQLKLYTPLT